MNNKLFSTARHFPAAVKRAAWKRCNGHCEGCTAPIAAGGFEYDHDICWELSRNSSLENCRVLCLACHRLKTAGEDLPAIVRTRHASDFHFGVAGPGKHDGPHLPCGRMSVTRKTIKGRVIERYTQSQLHYAAMVRRYGGFT
jgi:hypothetical protein